MQHWNIWPTYVYHFICTNFMENVTDSHFKMYLIMMQYWNIWPTYVSHFICTNFMENLTDLHF